MFSIHFCAFILFQCLFKGAFSGLRQFLATENLLKMMRNAFYITLKALFVLKMFQCLGLLFGYVEISLIRKKMLISKFMTLQLCK